MRIHIYLNMLFQVTLRCLAISEGNSSWEEQHFKCTKWEFIKGKKLRSKGFSHLKLCLELLKQSWIFTYTWNKNIRCLKWHLQQQLNVPRSAVMHVGQLARSECVNAMRFLSHQTGATTYTPPPRSKRWKVLLAQHCWESCDSARQPKARWRGVSAAQQYGHSCTSSQARLHLLWTHRCRMSKGCFQNRLR